MTADMDEVEVDEVQVGSCREGAEYGRERVEHGREVSEGAEDIAVGEGQ